VSGFYDVYVLSADRARIAIDRFLDRFAPQHEESASEYEIPQYSSPPVSVFRHAHELVDYCVVHQHEAHAIYWRRSAAGDPAHVMVFFTSDAAVIFGMSVSRDPQRWLDTLLEFAKSDSGYVGFEEPPPTTIAEFHAACERNRES
jgi:hypothetical protein